MMENILTHLSKVAVEHEKDEHGSRFLSRSEGSRRGGRLAYLRINR